MKVVLYDSSGKKKSEIEMPAIFSTPIREDLIAKYVEADKFAHMQPYGPALTAGRRHSASGVIRHQRHRWRGHYGKGIARLPRKTMYRRGQNFYWVGAEVANTRGGRSVHAPLPVFAYRKINKKEQKFAFYSALSSTLNPQYILRRYSSLSDKKSAAVIEELPSKTKVLTKTLTAIFGEISSIFMKKKEIRPGKGKGRGRKYKSNAGLLLVKGVNEKNNFKGIDVRDTKELSIADLYPLGRLTLYTKKAIEELSGEKK